MTYQISQQKGLSTLPILSHYERLVSVIQGPTGKAHCGRVLSRAQDRKMQKSKSLEGDSSCPVTFQCSCFLYLDVSLPLNYFFLFIFSMPSNSFFAPFQRPWIRERQRPSNSSLLILVRSASSSAPSSSTLKESFLPLSFRPSSVRSLLPVVFMPVAEGSTIGTVTLPVNLFPANWMTTTTGGSFLFAPSVVTNSSHVPTSALSSELPCRIRDNASPRMIVILKTIPAISSNCPQAFISDFPLIDFITNLNSKLPLFFNSSDIGSGYPANCCQ